MLSRISEARPGARGHLDYHVTKHIVPLYELTREALSPIPRTTMHEQFVREREDLQRLLKSSISIVGDNLFLLAEEFSQ